jgi:hypothetical protein
MTVHSSRGLVLDGCERAKHDRFELSPGSKFVIAGRTFCWIPPPPPPEPSPNVSVLTSLPNFS